MENETDIAPKAELKRRLTLWLVVFYGLGTTIGAGIYALVGEIAGIAGFYAPWSFLAAAVLAGFTAASYAEMANRFPRAAGAALYVKMGIGSLKLSTLVGLLVILAGLTSASALTNAFVGYVNDFAPVGRVSIILITIAAMGALAALGIRESVTVAGLITLIEIFGLLLVVAVNYGSFAELPARIGEFIPPLEFHGWGLVLSGAVLAFYAFLGFEDMVVVAEEVRDVKRTLPLAIGLTLVVTAILYFFVMTAAVLTVPANELAASVAPLAMLYQTGTGSSPTIMNAIASLAIINGALIQMIMASRMIYGLASTRQIPAALAYVHPRTHTPLIATAITTVVMILLALPGTLRGLAEATSVLMLVVFALVNLSAWRIKRQMPAAEGMFAVPNWVPLIGFVTSVAFALSRIVPW